LSALRNVLILQLNEYSHIMNLTPLPMDSQSVGVLHSRLGEDVAIYHPLGYRFETLVNNGLVDAVIVDSVDGFSQLGRWRDFLSGDLGLDQRNLAQYWLDGCPEKLERNISSLADWNCMREEVTLVAIPSGNAQGHLKGLILVPDIDSKCYCKFPSPLRKSAIHRDFIYNVTYEAISHAYHEWGARRIGITHLSRSKCNGQYEHALTMCQVEVMFHFCAEHRGMESFAFLDCTEGNIPLRLVDYYNSKADIGCHRPIKTKRLEYWGIDFIDLTW